MVDVVYIAASSCDAAFTRICVASVRTFYPTIPIRLLIGGRLDRGLARELRRHWNVTEAEVPKGTYGWGFVKLEPLYRPAGERFLVLDSDTVFTGPVLDGAFVSNEDFIVDDEDQLPERAREIYYDSSKSPENSRLLADPAFLFNTGQWFGKSGIFTREDFSGLLRWEFPRTLCFPDVFKNGEQGIFNFVVNEHWRAGSIRVARIPLMRWPGHGMEGFDRESVVTGSAPPRVVHWAGMKTARRRDMVGADLLDHFERLYYSRVNGGALLRGGRTVSREAMAELRLAKTRLVSRLRKA